MSRQTHLEIEAITDEGLFEDLALSVLRIAAPQAAALVQTGLNSEGRTHRSPLDAIGFLASEGRDHLVAVHHTVTAKSALRAKWLGEATTGGRAPGDVIKTLEIVEAERTQAPDLKATLLLTTSREPSETLVRDVRARGRERGVEVEIWSASRLAHVLDSTAEGQAVRRRILGRSQDRVSRSLLADIGRQTVAALVSGEGSAAWVPRTIGLEGIRNGVTFLVGGSGAGKTTTCLQALAAHLSSGGLGIVLPAASLAEAPTLEHAIEATLLSWHPSLADGRTALELATSSAPFLLVVEDINRSGDGPRLAAKLAGWSARAEPGHERTWKLICPIWPQLLGAMDDAARKAVEATSQDLPPLTMQEAAAIVQLRAELAGHSLTAMQAVDVAEAFGRDPLLIALHDFQVEADPDQVIGRYVEGALQAAARNAGATAPAFRSALDALMEQLVCRRELAPDWPTIEVCVGGGGQADVIAALLAERSLISLAGPSTAAVLDFRHDRVREHLLVRGLVRLQGAGRLPDDVLSDPGLIEVVGGALIDVANSAGLLSKVAELAPIALFDAFRRTAADSRLVRSQLLRALNRWIKGGGAEACSPIMRWAIAEKLGQADGPEVVALAESLGPLTLATAIARFRNGDLQGGIYLCYNVEPAVPSLWRDRCIAHAWNRHAPALSDGLVGHLRDTRTSEKLLCSVLRLIGHLAEPAFFDPVMEAWRRGMHTGLLLDDYIWAATRCMTGQVEELRPLYEAWAALSDEPKNYGSPRSNMTHSLKWPFAHQPPVHALPFLIQLLAHPNIGWSVQCLLAEIDHPVAVAAVAEAWAAAQRDRPTEKMNFGQAFRHRRWGNRRETETPMSDASRDALAALWSSPQSDDALCLASFELWSATRRPGDLAFLADTPHRSALDDSVLRARLQRGDVAAVPSQIERIRTSQNQEYWWQYGRDVWSPALTALLDETLSKGRLRENDGQPWIEGDWIQAELLMKLKAKVAEDLIVRHWSHIRQSPRFVQAALYVATPTTLALVADVVASAPEPAVLFTHIRMHYGYRTEGVRGVSRQAQIRALEPYLQHMADTEVQGFAEVCNSLGWHDLRREVLDPTGRSGRAHMTSDDLLASFDKMREDKHGRHWVDHSLEGILETGWTWPDVLEKALAWAETGDSAERARVVAHLIEAGGRRSDLSLLAPLALRYPTIQAEVDDTMFLVRRRSLADA